MFVDHRIFRTAAVVAFFAAPALFSSGSLASTMSGHEMKKEGHSGMKHSMADPNEMKKRMMKWMPIAEAKVGERIDGELTIINQDGKRVKLKEYFDKPFFITFMFADCPHVCPTINSSLAKAASAGKRKYGDSFRVLSISFDVGRDDVKRMKDYGDAFTDDFGFWTFGVAEKDTVKQLTQAFGFSYMPHPEEIWAHIAMVSAVGKGGVLTKQFYGMNVGVDPFLETLGALLKN